MTILRRVRRVLGRRGARQDGQVLVIVALSMVVLVGVAGLVIDLGRVYVAQKQLQQAVDAAALVAGQDLPNSTTAQSDAILFSATGKNAHSGMTAGSPTIQFKCLSGSAEQGLNLPCSIDGGSTPVAPCGPTGTGCNAVTVTQTASVKTTFLGIFLHSFNVTAHATASSRGGVPHPLDVVLVIDSTASMNSSCGDTVPGISGTANKIDCAKEGVRTLLSGLLPCNQALQSCGTAQPVDEASLMTFPPLINPAAFDHDTTNPGLHSDLSLEFGCPGNLNTAPSWYQTSSGSDHDEMQRVTVSGSGTFTLTFGGQTTGNLSKTTTTAAQLQSALQGLSSIGTGNVTVTGNTGGPWTVTFVGTLGNQNVAQMTSGGATVTTTSAGSAFDPGFPGWYLEKADITYSGSPTYQITPLSNDYKTSDTSGLNSSSSIVQAVYWTNCTGGAWPHNEYYGLNSPGGVNTYYAGAVNAAQALLMSDSARHAQPVIILLSDGDANTNAGGANPCQQAVTAATNAANSSIHTWVYSIAYGDTDTTSGCNNDSGHISAFTAMQQIARDTAAVSNGPDPSKFFCDPKPSGATCNSAATLNEIFQSIGEDLTSSRLFSG